MTDDTNGAPRLDHAQLRLELGSFLAGALDPAARLEVQEHLDTCGSCRDELTELAALPGLLARVHPEDLGPEDPAVPATLLPGLLARTRAAEARGRRQLRRWRVLAVGSVAAAAVALAAVLLTVSAPSAPSGPAYAFHRSRTAVPAAGTVTVAAKPWGAQLTLSVRGLPPRTSCEVVVEGGDGQAQVAGSWGPTPNHAAQVVVATRVPADRLRSVTVETAAGTPVLIADIGATSLTGAAVRSGPSMGPGTGRHHAGIASAMAAAGPHGHHPRR